MAAPRLTAITNTEALYNAAASSLLDTSGNNRTLSASGSAGYENGYDGSTNTAFDFDASWFPYRAGDYGLLFSDDITIQFRVKIDTQPSNATFALFTFITNDAANSRRATHITYIDTSGTKKFNFRHGGTLTDVTGLGEMTTGEWYDLALVIDKTASLVRGYFGQTGSGATEVLNTTLGTNNSGNAVGIQIGSEAGGGSIPTGSLRGDFSIDNFRIVKSARTEAEVIADFAAPSGPANVKSWNGVAIGDIKSINGLAIGDIKSINGLE